MADFQTRLANLLRARFPFVHVTTREEERLLSAIRQIAEDESLIKTPRKVIVWRATTGMVADGGTFRPA